MGTLFYGVGRLQILIDDATLACVKSVATLKQRRGEGFLLSWIDAAEVGHGRSSVWVHPHLDLLYKFNGPVPGETDAAAVEEMLVEANHAHGVELPNATLAQNPRR